MALDLDTETNTGRECDGPGLIWYLLFNCLSVLLDFKILADTDCSSLTGSVPTDVILMGDSNQKALILHVPPRTDLVILEKEQQRFSSHSRYITRSTTVPYQASLEIHIDGPQTSSKHCWAHGRRKRENRELHIALKALPGNDFSLCSVYLTKKINRVVVHDFKRMEMCNLPSGKSPMWVKGSAVKCFSIILSSTYLPSLFRRALQSLFWNPWG